MKVKVKFNKDVFSDSADILIYKGSEHICLLKETRESEMFGDKDSWSTSKSIYEYGTLHPQMRGSILVTNSNHELDTVIVMEFWHGEMRIDMGSKKPFRDENIDISIFIL